MDLNENRDIQIQISYYVEYRFSSSGYPQIWHELTSRGSDTEKEAQDLKIQCESLNRVNPNEEPKEYRVARITITREHEVLP